MGDGDVAQFHGEAVGALEEGAIREDHAAAEAGAGGGEDEAGGGLAAEQVFAVGGGVAVVGHEDRFADEFGELRADVGADPVVAEVGAAPDDAVAGRRRDVDADGGDVFDASVRVFAEEAQRFPELVEGFSVALFDVGRDFDAGADLAAGGVDEHGFDGRAADIETGEVGVAAGGFGGSGHGFGGGSGGRRAAAVRGAGGNG